MNDICFSFIIISPCLNKFIGRLFRVGCTIRCHLVCSHGASKTLFFAWHIHSEAALVCALGEAESNNKAEPKRESVCVCECVSGRCFGLQVSMI